MAPQAASVSSVAKATRLLHAFTPLAGTLSIRQLAERTGVPRSTAHALCVTLCQADLLELVPGRGYRLGPALVSLGGQVIDRTGLVEAAAGVTERLARGDGLEVHLGQLVGGWVVYVQRSAGGVRAAMRNRVGLRAPAHRTGCGKAALSLLPDDEVERRVKAACAAEHLRPPDPAALAGELAAARRAGWILSSTFQAGRSSIAAAVVGPLGNAVGGLSVAGPSELFGAALVGRLSTDVTEAACRIGGRLERGGPGGALT